MPRKSARCATPSTTSRSEPKRNKPITHLIHTCWVPGADSQTQRSAPSTFLMKRRVVVTGMGMISPLGVGNEPTWQGLIEGRSGIDCITKFDTKEYAVKIAGE